MSRLSLFICFFAILALLEIAIYELVGERSEHKVAAEQTYQPSEDLERNTERVVEVERTHQTSKEVKTNLPEKESRASRPENLIGTGPSTPKPPDNSKQVRYILDIWERLSNEIGLLKEVDAELILILQEVSKKAGPLGTLRKEDLGDFEESLKRFIGMHYRTLKGDANSARRTLYWLALCMQTATARSGLSKEQHKATLASYSQFIDELGMHIDEKFRHVLGENYHKKWRAEIHQGIAQLKADLLSRVTTLSNDYLCPAFRRALSEEERKEVLRYFSKPKRYPKYVEPKVVMRNSEQYYVAHLERFFVKAEFVAIGKMFIEPVYKIFWPNAEFSTSQNSIKKFWPMYVRILPEWARKQTDTGHGAESDDDIF